MGFSTFDPSHTSPKHQELFYNVHGWVSLMEINESRLYTCFWFDSGPIDWKRNKKWFQDGSGLFVSGNMLAFIVHSWMDKKSNQSGPTNPLGSHLLRRRTFPVHQSQSWREIPACESMDEVIWLCDRYVYVRLICFNCHSRSSLDHVSKS